MTTTTPPSGLKEQIAAFVDQVLLHETWAESGDEAAERIMSMVEAECKGWRPPLPETEGPSPWDAYVAAYREFQEADPHGATAHPTAHHMHALEAALRVAKSPLPDSETEWASTAEIAGFLSTIMPVGNAYGAANFLDRGYHLTRREVTS